MWYGLTIGWSILLLPFFILLLALCALGVGMMIASVGVYKRDVVFGLPFILQIWMLASPIMYPLTMVPESWRLAYSLNRSEERRVGKACVSTCEAGGSQNH